MMKYLIIAVVVWLIIGLVRKSRGQEHAFNWTALLYIGAGYAGLKLIRFLIVCTAVVIIAVITGAFGFLFG